MGMGSDNMVAFGLGDTIVLLIDELPPDVSIFVEPQGRSRESRERSRQMLPEQWTVRASLVALNDTDAMTLSEGHCTKLFEHTDECTHVGSTLATVTRVGAAYLVEAAYEGVSFSASVPIAYADNVIVKTDVALSGSALFIAARKIR